MNINSEQIDLLLEQIEIERRRKLADYENGHGIKYIDPNRNVEKVKIYNNNIIEARRGCGKTSLILKVLEDNTGISVKCDCQRIRNQSAEKMPMVALHWEKYFQHIREKYNSIYKVQMPCITPHVCRHTFCSKMAKAGMNPKTLQYIMGHSDIGVTLNTYTHLQFDDALEEMKELSLKEAKKVCNG